MITFKAPESYEKRSSAFRIIAAIKSKYNISGKILFNILANPNKTAYANVLNVLDGVGDSTSAMFLLLLNFCEANITHLEE